MKFEKNFFLSQGDELLFEDRGDFESKCELLNLENDYALNSEKVTVAELRQA